MKKNIRMPFRVKWHSVRYNKANESSGNFFKALNLQADDLV
jgi:hypothetical protein